MSSDADVLERQQERGWLLPYLWVIDAYGWHKPGGFDEQERLGNYRWVYWNWIVEHKALPEEPIPHLAFQPTPSNEDAKLVQEWLTYPVSHYGWWYDEAWLHLVNWMLHGFGRRQMDDAVQRIPDDVKAQWYRQVDLHVLLRNPCDWSAFILQGGLQRDKRKASPWAKSTGFFSTPMQVVNMMVDMSMGMDKGKPLEDTRLLTVCDPCCGTGSMLLAASNYSLRLYGMDIVLDLCLCTELNGWLWAPWLVWMPDAVQEMLEERYRTLERLRVMRCIITGDVLGPSTRVDQEAPTGVALSHNPLTVEKAHQRRASAERFWEAARKGEVEQLDMFEV
jgi:hypothetical protein